MSWVSANFIKFAVDRPLGQKMLDGTMKIPAGDPVEQDLPVLVDAMAVSLKDDSKVDEKLLSSKSFEVFRALAEKAAEVSDPKQPEKFPFGYSLLPTRLERSETPGILAVDLNPIDMRFTSQSPVYPEPAARLFIDTTPGKDGLDYLISY
ncbi:hypothetical protein JST97_02535 [bacterium]|nr:hypothetical protein [bacterium]